MLGRQAKKLIKLMYGGLHGESETTVPEYAYNMRTSFEETCKYVHEKVGAKLKHQKWLYNKKIHSQPYKPGDLVRLLNPSVPKEKQRSSTTHGLVHIK